jgi:hypothetical protein
MERRTFLLGLVGGLAAAAGLAAAGSTPAEALPLKAAPGHAPSPADAPAEPADLKAEDLDGVRTEEAQYYYYRRRYRPWRRRYYRRYYWRPRRRYYRRYYRRRYW